MELFLLFQKVFIAEYDISWKEKEVWYEKWDSLWEGVLVAAHAD